MNRLHTSIMRTAVALLLGAPVAVTGASSVAAQHAGDTLPAISGPSLVVNGGFEQGADPGDHLELAVGTSPLLAGWTVTNRYVDAMGTYWKAEEGTRSIGLNYDGNGVLADASSVKQTFPTIIGTRYLATFYQGAMTTSPTTVRFTIAGQKHDYTYQFAPTDTMPKIPWVERSMIFTASKASTTIEFDALYTKGYWIALDNVQVHALATSVTPTPGTGKGTPQTGVITGTVTLQIATPAIAAGSAQTIRGAAGKNAAVAVVVDYPDGTQLLVPLKAGADGHYTDKWTVPATIHGTVRVLVDSAGKTAHGSFTVS